MQTGDCDSVAARELRRYTSDMDKHEQQQRLPASALFGALLVSVIWGLNFIAIKVGVSGVPPLLLAAIRFVLSAFPAVLFVKRPKVPVAYLAAYGLLLGIGEFGLLFTAIKLGAPAGLSSIILQSQAFFTALLAVAFLKEHVHPHNVLGMGVAALGLAVVAVSGNTGTLSLALTAMLLLASFFWAAANVVARSMPKTDGLALMVWSSLFSPLPLLVLSLVFEGPAAIAGSLAHLGLVSIGAIAYLVMLSTLFGYGVWNQLIMRHGAGRIAPFSLLVPIFGVSAGALVFGEHFAKSDGIASALVLSGLLIHVFGGPKPSEPKAHKKISG